MAIYAAEGVLLDGLIPDPKPGGEHGRRDFQGCASAWPCTQKQSALDRDLVFSTNTFDREQGWTR